MPHTVLHISGYACVVYLIILQLFSETASFYKKLTIWYVRVKGHGEEKGLYIFILPKGREIKLGSITQEIFRTQGKTKNIYVWKVFKLSQTRSYKAHIFILNIECTGAHTRLYL